MSLERQGGEQPLAVKAAAAALGAAAGFAGPDAAVAAASDETYQELLARTLTIAQDTAMRDKRRAPRHDVLAFWRVAWAAPN